MIDLTGYKLTFDDEFNTRSISWNGATTWHDARDEWRMADGKAEVGFGKSSFMDPSSGYDPFSVKDGALTITAAPPGTTSAGVPGSWQSGLITTQGTFSQKYGYFEMRADVSETQGGWDAFWMVPNQQAPATPGSEGGWQELDVVEHYGNNPTGVYSTIHTTDPSNGVPWQVNRQVYSEHDTSGYHTYGVNWQADKLDFYYDGQLMGSQATPADYKNPMYMIANLATQDNAVASQSMKIDYIRAYANDGSNPTVAQDTISAPDSKDPGLYGATALTGQPPATNPDPVTPSPVTNSPASATGSTNATAVASSTAVATGSATNANDMANTAGTGSTGVANQTSGATGSPVGTANTTTSPASTSNPVSTAGAASTSSASSLDGPQSASSPAAGSIATTGTTTSTGATGAVQQAAPVETSSSTGSASPISGSTSTTDLTGAPLPTSTSPAANAAVTAGAPAHNAIGAVTNPINSTDPVPATSAGSTSMTSSGSTLAAQTAATSSAGTTGSTDQATSTARADTSSPTPTGSVNSIDLPNTATSTGAPGSATTATTDANSLMTAHSKAAIAMMVKFSQSSGGQPTLNGPAHSFSDAMFYFD